MRRKALLRLSRVVEAIVGDGGGPARSGIRDRWRQAFVRYAVSRIHHVVQHAQHDGNELASVAKRYYDCYRW